MALQSPASRGRPQHTPGSTRGQAKKSKTLLPDLAEEFIAFEEDEATVALKGSSVLEADEMKLILETRFKKNWLECPHYVRQGRNAEVRNTLYKTAEHQAALRKVPPRRIMKSFSVALVLASALLSSADASQASPIEKVLEMISGLQTKVISEGKDAQKTYDEYAEWCSDRSTNLAFEIKTGKANLEELKATIQDETSTSAAMETKIEELSNDIQTNEADLAAASKIREQEASDFAAEEKELTTVISMLERATSILSKEMAKSGASMLQLKGATSIADALRVMVQASVLSSADASQLTALVQTDQDSSDSDSELGSPAASVYEGQSDGIIGVLEGLTEKAESQLDKARKSESSSLQNFQMLKQSLTDEIKFAEKDMDKAKKSLAQSQENKAVATGDLDTTSKDLASDIATKSTLHQEKAAYEKNSAEMEMGINGVKKALSVLKDYYAKADKSHGSADGAGSGIIGLLEVCESDFIKGLTEMTAAEETSASDHEAYSKQDEIDTAAKSQDVKYKGKEAAGLDKSASELSGDLATASDELAAVNKGLDKLKEMCVAKAEPYAEKKARREAEISGLKEALQILESETALLQTHSKHSLRGVHL